MGGKKEPVTDPRISGHETWRGPRPFPVWAPAIFFSSLGIGYAAAAVVFLGAPVRLLGINAFTLAVLPALVLFASFFGSRFSGGVAYSVTSARRRCAVLTGILLIGVLMVTETAGEWHGASLETRLLVSLVIAAASGFFLGIPFPAVLALLRARPGIVSPSAWRMIFLCVLTGTVLTLGAAAVFSQESVRLVGPSSFLVAAITAEDL